MIKLNRKLQSITSRNQALQDILKTLAYGYELISIEEIPNSSLNTKLVVRIPSNPLPRTHYYNRTHLKDVLNELSITSINIRTILGELNLKGCDFTLDDVEYVDGKIIAKPDSLGYYGEVHIVPSGILLLSDGAPIELNNGDVLKLANAS